MDRLSALTLAALVVPLGACRDSARPRETAQRFNAVEAEPQPAAKIEGFCDVQGKGDKARIFGYPALASPAPAVDGRPRWVNVWATWCKPCVQELPLLVRWQAQLAKDGAPFELVLLSLDSDDDAVEHFRQQHPGTPPTLRIKDPAQAETWVATLGLDRASAIPIHAFVNRQGQIRCARTGGVSRDHLPTVQAILRGG
jgi:thiol-disulfide isomerase/thioredoxin